MTHSLSTLGIYTSYTLRYVPPTLIYAYRQHQACGHWNHRAQEMGVLSTRGHCELPLQRTAVPGFLWPRSHLHLRPQPPVPSPVIWVSLGFSLEGQNWNPKGGAYFKPVVLKHFSLFTPLKIIENPKEPLLMWIVAMDIY